MDAAIKSAENFQPATGKLSSPVCLNRNALSKAPQASEQRHRLPHKRAALIRWCACQRVNPAATLIRKKYCRNGKKNASGIPPEAQIAQLASQMHKVIRDVTTPVCFLAAY
ncbi:MAG: hypothetical protein KDJ29_01255 [Hyphomicrobiales bacterium]|nr:hypothetical protein [Hyphomicrobiales bacterium]